MNRKHFLAQNVVGLIGAAIGATLLITTTPSFADDAKSPNCKDSHHFSGHGEHGGFPMNAQARLDKLKTALKIQPAQESAWQAFASKVEAQREKMKSLHQQAKPDEALSLPDRLDRHLSAMKEREADLQDMSTATKNLYAALSPEQRAVMDKHFSHHHWQRARQHG